MSVIELLSRQTVIPVLRTATAASALRVARALRSAGAQAVELTLTTPDVLAAVRELAAEGMTVGVGTVSESAQVEAAMAAGARFVVSYGQPPGYVEAAQACGIPCLAGALTPEEVRRALAAGADAVKIYPASLVSPQYLRDLRSVMPSVRLVPSGGISPQAEVVRAWLDQGALAVAIGSALANEADAEQAWRDLAAGLG